MNLSELRKALKAHGATPMLTETITVYAPNELPVEVVEALRVHKSELLAELRAQQGPSIKQLPEPVARLLVAASNNQLNHPAYLRTGIVQNLGDRVAGWAMTHLANGSASSREQLLEAWQAWTNNWHSKTLVDT